MNWKHLVTACTLAALILAAGWLWRLLPAPHVAEPQYVCLHYQLVSGPLPARTCRPI